MKILRSVLGSCLALLITTQTALSMQKPLQGTKLNVVEGALRNKLSQNIANMNAQQYWKWSQDVYSNFNQLPSSLQNTYKKKIRDKKYSLSQQTKNMLLNYWAGEINRAIAARQVNPQLLTMLQDASDFIDHAPVTGNQEYRSFITSIATLNNNLRTRADSPTYTAFKNAIGEQNLRTITSGTQPITPAPSQPSMTPEQRLAQAQNLLNRVINHFAQQFAATRGINEPVGDMRNLVSRVASHLQDAYITSRSNEAIDTYKNRVREIATELAANLMNAYRANERFGALISALQYYFIVYLVGIVDEGFADELGDIFDTAAGSANDAENIVNNLLSTLNLSPQLQMEFIGSILRPVQRSMSQPGSIPALEEVPSPTGGSQQPAAPEIFDLAQFELLPGETITAYQNRMRMLVNTSVRNQVGNSLNENAILSTGTSIAITWQELLNELINNAQDNTIYNATAKLITLNTARSAETTLSNPDVTSNNKSLLTIAWIIRLQIWKFYDAAWADANLAPIVTRMIRLLIS